MGKIHRIKDDRMEKYGAYVVCLYLKAAIAAMQNVLADGRNSTLLPSPPPYTLWRTHRPPLYPIPIPISVVCGCRRAGTTASPGAPSALKQIVPISSSL